MEKINTEEPITAKAARFVVNGAPAHWRLLVKRMVRGKREIRPCCEHRDHAKPAAAWACPEALAKLEQYKAACGPCSR